jgi:hypothetical protein
MMRPRQGMLMSDLDPDDGFRYAPEYFLYIHCNLDKSPCRYEILF